MPSQEQRFKLENILRIFNAVFHELNLQDKVSVSISEGTESTPGLHIRFEGLAGSPEALAVQQVFARYQLINFEEKFKGKNSLFVVRDIKEDFSRMDDRGDILYFYKNALSDLTYNKILDEVDRKNVRVLSGEALYEASKHADKIHDLTRKRQLLQLAVEKNYSKAYGVLGAEWIQSTPPRFDLAKSLFEQGIKAGDYKSAFNLARMHEKGDGMVANPAMAISLYRKALDFGPPSESEKSRVKDKIVGLSAGLQQPRAVAHATFNSTATPQQVETTLTQRPSVVSMQDPSAASMRDERNNARHWDMRALKTLEGLEDAIKQLNLPSDTISTEIDLGPTNGTEHHLCIMAGFSLEVLALEKALNDLGVQFEEKSKNGQPMLVIQKRAPLPVDFSKQLETHYIAALDDLKKTQRQKSEPIAPAKKEAVKPTKEPLGAEQTHTRVNALIQSHKIKKQLSEELKKRQPDKARVDALTTDLEKKLHEVSQADEAILRRHVPSIPTQAPATSGAQTCVASDYSTLAGMVSDYVGDPRFFDESDASFIPKAPCYQLPSLDPLTGNTLFHFKDLNEAKYFFNGQAALGMRFEVRSKEGPPLFRIQGKDDGTTILQENKSGRWVPVAPPTPVSTAAQGGIKSRLNEGRPGNIPVPDGAGVQPKRPPN